MFHAEHDVARYIDPVNGEDNGGSYGAFIGAPLDRDRSLKIGLFLLVAVAFRVLGG